MNKIFGLVLAVFFLLMIGTVSAVPSLTVISGTISQADDVTPVANADIKVTCNGNVKMTTSNGLGSYGVVYPVSQCAVEDSVLVEATKDSADGSNTGVVSHEGTCVVNTGIINVSIPEFGVVAGAVALVGALGIFVYRRKN